MTRISIAPKQDSSSVGVLLATPNDNGPMRRVTTWVKAFAEPVGEPGITVRSLGAIEGRAPLVGPMIVQAFDATVPTATLDSAFGGLRGHTLVWVSPRHVPASGKGEGLVAFAGASDQSVTIALEDVQPMQVVSTGQLEVVVHPQQGSDDRLARLALFVSLLRISFYTQIYLCVVANQHRPAGGKPSDRPPEPLALDALAAKLNELTGCTIYYNDAAIEIDGSGTAVVPTGATLSPASGVAFLSTKSVALSAPAGSFFPGSKKRT